MPYCKHDRHIKGGQKTIAFFGLFFQPTSDVYISETVYLIYLKIKVQRVPTSHSSYINFQANPNNPIPWDSDFIAKGGKTKVLS